MIFPPCLGENFPAQPRLRTPKPRGSLPWPSHGRPPPGQHEVAKVTPGTSTEVCAWSWGDRRSKHPYCWSYIQWLDDIICYLLLHINIYVDIMGYDLVYEYDKYIYISVHAICTICITKIYVLYYIKYSYTLWYSACYSIFALMHTKR